MAHYTTRPNNIRFYTFIILVWVSCTSLAQTKQYALKAGIIAQGNIYNRYIEQSGGILRRITPDSKSANASVGLGLVIENIWHYQKSAVSLTAAFRYARIFSYDIAYLYPDPEKYGVAVDAHLQYKFNLSGLSWITGNSQVGIGLSLINIGLRFNNRYDILILNPPNNIRIEYTASTLMFPGLNATFAKTFGDRLSIQIMGIYSQGSWAQWEPIANFLIHGNVSLQYIIVSPLR